MRPFLFDKLLYKYRCSKNLKQILETSTLFFNCPAQFNDPFEFSLDLLKFNFTKKEIEEYLEVKLRTTTQLSRLDRRKLIHSTGQQIFHKSVNNTLTQKRNEYGVFCGSEIYDSTLMWSHYADNHAGFCIGLKFPETINFLTGFMSREQMLSFYVNYVDEITPMPFMEGTILLPDESMNYWFTSKSKVWEYEKEIRLIKYLGKGAVKIEPSWVKELYIGLSTPQKDVDDVLSFAKEKGFSFEKICKMGFAKNSFRLVTKTI